MNHRLALVASLLLAASLAGCFGGGEADDDTPGTTTTTSSTTASATTSTQTTTSTTSPPAQENSPPGATLVASSLRGAAPLTVNFTIEAADDDGDLLDWTFDADGDAVADAEGEGTNFTEQFAFNYTDAGIYLANLTVDDGQGGSVSKTLEVNVTSAGVNETASIQNWYFSEDPDAATCISDFLIESLEDAKPDSTACQYQIANPILGAADMGLVEVATAQSPSMAFDAGTAVEGSIYVSHVDVDALVGILTIMLETAEGTALGSEEITIVHDDPQSDYRADFSLETAAAIVDGDVLVLKLDYQGPAAGISWGGGPDKPTGFAVGGAYEPA